MVSRRYASIVDHHPATIPRAVLCVCGGSDGEWRRPVAVAATATARSWWRPVPIYASREPPPSERICRTFAMCRSDHAVRAAYPQRAFATCDAQRARDARQ